MTWPIAPSRFDPNSPGSTDLFGDIIAQILSNSSDISSTVNASNVPPLANGSFELDASGTVIPTGWDYTALPGGSGQVTNTESSHGANSYKATHPGGALNGGVVLRTLVALPVSASQAFELYFDTFASVAGVRTTVKVHWYDGGLSEIAGSPVTVFDQNGSYPTPADQPGFRSYSVGLSPFIKPSAADNARYMALEITLGDVALSNAADIFIDNIALTFRRQLSRYSVFTSTGTFTPPPGVNRIKVLMWGGGGWANTPSSNIAGAGAYLEGFLDVHPGVPVAVNVGAGGVNFPILNRTGGSSSMTSEGITLLCTGGGPNPGAGRGVASGGYLNLGGTVPQSNAWTMVSPNVPLGPLTPSVGYGWGGRGSDGSDGRVIIFY